MHILLCLWMFLLKTVVTARAPAKNMILHIEHFCRTWQNQRKGQYASKSPDLGMRSSLGISNRRHCNRNPGHCSYSETEPTGPLRGLFYLINQNRDMKYASRAGEKLEHALATFKISVAGLVCADFGSSAGGFVDCLLQHGAQKVYAVETGYGVLDWKLRNDPRVIVMERQNAMHVVLPEKVDF